ncbi:hypothetical protein EZS27_021503 [termite gut metagenome]|jgi:hypothetical protein|uniref:Uncharacterized protein n=1 Tax=termite gut metagenome TaxID=433724 RepID=A0A5J4R7M6_9ZZZZ
MEEETHWVYNGKNTSRWTYSYAWIYYWEENTGLTAHRCSACGDVTGKLVGAHVYKAGILGRRTSRLDRNYYIVPLCYSCNNFNNDYKFKVTSIFVPVPSNN